MSSPLATVEAVQRLLADTGLPDRELLTPEQYDDAIQWAVAVYGRDRPLLVSSDIAGAGSEYIALHELGGWADGLSTVQFVEYPAGTVGPGYDPTYVSSDWYTILRPAEGEVYLRLLGGAPAVGETVRVGMTALHVHTVVDDVEVSTIPDAHWRAFLALAASRACLILAARGAGDTEGRQGIDDMNYGDKRNRYEAMATAFRKSYEQILGIGLASDQTPVVASGRRRWQSVPALERAAVRLIRGTR